MIFGNVKPAVYVKKGDLLVTTETEISHSGGDFTLLEAFPFRTVEGRLVLARAGRETRITLTGPETNYQLEEIINIVRQYAHTILIDGACDRVTQIAGSDNSVFFYIFSIDNINLNSSIDRIWQLTDFSLTGNDYSDRAHKISGIVTKNILDNIEKEIDEVVIEDFTRIFISPSDWKKIRKKYKISFRKSIELCRIVVNLKNIKESVFVERLRDKGVGTDRILFNPYVDRKF